MIITSCALVASAAVLPGGTAAAASGTLADLVRASIGQELDAFAGYHATTVDGTASTIITIPDASECTELELTGAVSFMGTTEEGGEYAYNFVAAKCEPDAPAEYIAVIQTPESGGGVQHPGPLAAGDKIKITIDDNGTETTVTMTNLSDGTSIEVTTATLPDTYEVGTTSFGTALVGGAVSFTKNRLDGAKLKAADPTKVTFDDGGTKFKPTRLKRGQNFQVKTS